VQQPSLFCLVSYLKTVERTLRRTSVIHLYTTECQVTKNMVLHFLFRTRNFFLQLTNLFKSERWYEITRYFKFYELPACFYIKNSNIKMNAIIFYLFFPDSVESSHTLLAELCSVRMFLRSVLNTLSTSSFWRVVTMVYNTRNFWVSGLYPSSGVWRKTTFRKLDLIPSSGKRGGGRHLLSWASKKELISLTGQLLSNLHHRLNTWGQARQQLTSDWD
jgi:hypothetical protein